MRNIFILLITLFTISFCYGQDTTQLKRVPYKLTVAVDKNSVYEEEIKATGYVLPNKAIQLYPGETVYVFEVEQDNGVIKSLTLVKEIKDSSKTLTLSFTQSTKKKVHEMMMLKVINPLPFKLIYKASIFLFVQKKWVNADVYPVEAGLSGFETW